MSTEQLIHPGSGEHRPGPVPRPAPFQGMASVADAESRLAMVGVTLVRDIPRHTRHTFDELTDVRAGELAAPVDGEDCTMSAARVEPCPGSGLRGCRR